MVNMNGPVKMASYDMAGQDGGCYRRYKGYRQSDCAGFWSARPMWLLAGRHDDECSAVAEAITAAGGHGKGIRTDVRNIDEINALIAGAAETFGGVDILD